MCRSHRRLRTAAIKQYVAQRLLSATFRQNISGTAVSEHRIVLYWTGSRYTLTTKRTYDICGDRRRPLSTLHHASAAISAPTLPNTEWPWRAGRPRAWTPWRHRGDCSVVCYNTIQYNTIQCNAMQCSAVQCSAVQCSAVQCSAVQYSTVQYTTVQYTTVQCNTVQYNTLSILKHNINKFWINKKKF